MNDAPKNGAGTPPAAQEDDFSSDQAIENAALAGAAAIQRLVAERNNLRNRLAAQQRELATMHAYNEDLRRRLFVLHQRYVDVAKRVVGQLEQFDGTMREVIQEGQKGAAPREEPAPAPQPTPDQASLVQRLAETDMPLDLDLEDDAPQAES
jgi:hypothetical protein